MIGDSAVSSLGVGDWIGIGTFLGAQLWAAGAYLSKSFAKRDEALAEAIRERNNIVTGIRAELHAAREQARVDVARIERESAAAASKIEVRLATLPTRESLDASLERRIAPLESDLRALVIELARRGTTTAKPAHPAFRPDDGA